MERKIEVSVKNGKYGIADKAADWVIIPFEYDNIFNLHSNPLYPLFILYKSGKVGAVYINNDNSYNWIAPCEYYFFTAIGIYSFIKIMKQDVIFPNPRLVKIF